MRYVKTINGEIGFATEIRPHYWEVKTVDFETFIYHESDLFNISDEEYENAWDEAQIEEEA